MVIDDRFEIPEEIQKMSDAELAREIAILEKERRKIAETLPDMEPLVAVQQKTKKQEMAMPLRYRSYY